MMPVVYLKKTQLSLIMCIGEYALKCRLSYEHFKHMTRALRIKLLR